MIQHPYCNSCYGGAPTEMNVPTAAQLSGDFNNTGVPQQVISSVARRLCTALQYGRRMAGLRHCYIRHGQGTYTGLNSLLRPDGLLLTKSEPAANQTPNADQRLEQLWNDSQHSAEPLGSDGQGHLRLQRQQQAVGLLHVSDGNRSASAVSMVGAGMDHSLSLATGREGNGSRLPGQLHPRVQRHDDQRVRILVCGIRERHRPHATSPTAAARPWLPGAEPLRSVQDRPDSELDRWLELPA